VSKEKKLIEIKEFREKIKAGESVKDVLIKKKIDVETKVLSEEDRVIRFTASTAEKDRDNDRINPVGWDLLNFIKNPVFLWSHNYEKLSIGKVVNYEITDKALIEDVEFVNPEELYPGTPFSDLPEDLKFADLVYQMYKKGFLNAVSVGFSPVDYEYNDKNEGFDFKKQEQLELSGVTVPANPEALAAGLKSFDDKEFKKMKKLAEEVLQLEKTAGEVEVEVKVNAEEIDDLKADVKELTEDVKELNKSLKEAIQLNKSLKECDGDKGEDGEEKEENETEEEEKFIEIAENESFEISETELEEAVKNAITAVTGKIL